MQRRSWPYLLAALGVIAAGLAWRTPGIGLPPVAAKYGGSVLWGAMVFLLLATAMARTSLSRVAATAAVVAAAVEFSQLIRIDWLDAFRATTAGALLLGRTFSWWDILAYWAGIAIACAVAAVAARADGR